MRLNQDFEGKVKRALDETLKVGYKLEPYRGFYTARAQALLWCRSRCERERKEAAKTIEKEGAPTVARLIREAKPHPGRKETDLLPGQSWHQYGEALDVRLIGPEGRVIWAPGHHGYETFAKKAAAEGLTAGYYWRKQDSNHIQLRDQSVRAVMTWAMIDEIVRKELGES